MAEAPSGNTHLASVGMLSFPELNIEPINPANTGIDAPMDYQEDNLPK